MALNKTLNATCDMDGCLFCRMPEEALEVEVKSRQNGENTPCFRTLTSIQRSTTPGTEQTGEVVYILEGGGHTEEEEELNNVEGNRYKFIGNYCENCVGTYDRCWCNSSDWGEELVDIESPTNADLTLESKRPSPKSVKKTPSGWA